MVGCGGRGGLQNPDNFGRNNLGSTYSSRFSTLKVLLGGMITMRESLKGMETVKAEAGKQWNEGGERSEGAELMNE